MEKRAEVVDRTSSGNCVQLSEMLPLEEYQKHHYRRWSENCWKSTLRWRNSFSDLLLPRETVFDVRVRVVGVRVVDDEKLAQVRLEVPSL